MTKLWRMMLIATLVAPVAIIAALRSEIVCPEGSTGASCRSFRDAVEDNDKDIVEAVRRREHVIVCFRPDEDVFLLLSYDSPVRTSWQKAGSQTEFEQPGTVEFTVFRNGYANHGGESILAVGHRLTSSVDNVPSRFSGISLIPDDDGKIRIDSDGVRISHAFKRRRNEPLTHYEFSMKNSDDTFAETLVEPKGPIGADRAAKVAGKCVTYK